MPFSNPKFVNPQIFLTERDSVTRFSTSSFFHESVSPKPLSIPIGSFEFFRKFAEILAAQCAPPVTLTPVANGKTFNHKSFNYTGGKFAAGNVDTVSTTPAKQVAKFAASVVDTIGAP